MTYFFFMTLWFYTLYFFLYSEGDMFVLFMKALRKALIELNPERSAISLILV